MHFVYIDESGNTSLNDRYQRFFVLVALIATSGECLSLEENFNAIKLRRFPGIQPEEIEIKGRSLIYGHGFFEKVIADIRQAMLAELHGILANHPLSLLATVVDKADRSLHRLGLLPDDVYRYGYKNLVSRVDQFVRQQNSQGLVLIDSRASSIRSSLADGRLVAIHRELLQGMKRQHTVPSIVEYPIFVQSQFFGAVQLADICAYQLFHALQTHPDVQDVASLEHSSHPSLDIVVRLLKPAGHCERIP